MSAGAWASGRDGSTESGDTVLVRGVARVACKPVQWTGENDERRELGRAARREWKP